SLSSATGQQSVRREERMFQRQRFARVMAASVLTVSLGSTLPGTAQQAEQGRAGQRSKPASRQSYQSIPIELFRHSLIFLQARINPSEPMWFLLDSASTWSFLDAAKASALGLKTEGNRTIHGAGENPTEITFAQGVSLDLSGVKLSDQTFAI